LLGAATTAALTLAGPAAAQNGAIVTYGNHCILPWEGLAPQKVAVRVGACTSQGARYTLGNGVAKTSDNLCLDHGVAAGMTPNSTNDGVVFVPCNPSYKSQTWYFVANGLAQNAANPAVCLDIEGGSDNVQTRLIVWPCDFKSDAQNANCIKGQLSYCPKANQRFFIGKGGVSTATLQAMGVPAAGLSRLASGLGFEFVNNGMRIVAGGGGNIVAAGGGNFSPAGGGASIVAGGGGNIYDKYGTVVLGLIGQDGTSLTSATSLANGIRLGGAIK
jgi:hypothetical protein